MQVNFGRNQFPSSFWSTDDALNINFRQFEPVKTRCIHQQDLYTHAHKCWMVLVRVSFSLMPRRSADCPKTFAIPLVEILLADNMVPHGRITNSALQDAHSLSQRPQIRHDQRCLCAQHTPNGWGHFLYATGMGSRTCWHHLDVFDHYPLIDDFDPYEFLPILNCIEHESRRWRSLLHHLEDFGY